LLVQVQPGGFLLSQVYQYQIKGMAIEISCATGLALLAVGVLAAGVTAVDVSLTFSAAGRLFFYGEGSDTSLEKKPNDE